jgi:thiol-disulfide isomerase/thioredoxin
LNDSELLVHLRARVERHTPKSLLACSVARGNQNENSPPPANSDKNSQKAVPERAESSARQQLRRCPADWPSLMRVWISIHSRAHRGEAGVGSAEDLAIADQMIRLRQTSPDAGIEFPPLQTTVARVYVAGKVRLTEVPKLLDAGLQAIERQEKYRPAMELIPEDMRDRVADWRTATARQTEEIRLDYFLATNRPADARVIAEQVLAELAAIPPKSDLERERHRHETKEWLRRLGNVDAQEGRVEDALSRYQASVSGMSKEVLARAVPNWPQLMTVKQYYLAHGGTEAGWPDWATKDNKLKASVERTPLQFVKALPEFSVTDLTGKIWRLDSLHGVATFVNLWATWCGPCRGEHTDVQKLYEAIKGRKDVQVLTISVDESPDAVKRYVKEKGYTFPVIHAPELADRLFPYVGLPTNFLVNANGMRTSLYGFVASEEGRQRVVQDLENAQR